LAFFEILLECAAINLAVWVHSVAFPIFLVVSEVAFIVAAILAVDHAPTPTAFVVVNLSLVYVPVWVIHNAYALAYILDKQALEDLAIGLSQNPRPFFLIIPTPKLLNIEYSYIISPT
jgi:hypothetical protein